jgi:hypothetical protein
MSPFGKKATRFHGGARMRQRTAVFTGRISLDGRGHAESGKVEI